MIRSKFAPSLGHENFRQTSCVSYELYDVCVYHLLFLISEMIHGVNYRAHWELRDKYFVNSLLPTMAERLSDSLKK